MAKKPKPKPETCFPQILCACGKWFWLEHWHSHWYYYCEKRKV